jgi:hypothetical protein
VPIHLLHREEPGLHLPRSGKRLARRLLSGISFPFQRSVHRGIFAAIYGQRFFPRFESLFFQFYLVITGGKAQG